VDFHQWFLRVPVMQRVLLLCFFEILDSRLFQLVAKWHRYHLLVEVNYKDFDLFIFKGGWLPLFFHLPFSFSPFFYLL
jgi:hypothetical protein